MTSAFVDDARYLAAAITKPLAVVPGFDAQMTAAITAAIASAGVTAPSEHFLASVRFTAEVCYGSGGGFAAAATEGVATWMDLA
jgi:hypothetical protein